MSAPYRVELLTTKHDREGFDCGEKSLNDFLKHYARQNNEKGLGRTYVAVVNDEPRIYGYYMIANGNIGFDTIPDKLPRYPIPVVHLGRLAVDEAAKGQRLGQALLADALKRAVKLSDQIGIYAVDVRALTEGAREFYLRCGFAEMLDDRLHLYMTIKKIRTMV